MTRSLILYGYTNGDLTSITYPSGRRITKEKGKRLNPRKADLERWREGFAERLRENGISANATPRKTRGETRKYVSQPILHRAQRMGITMQQEHITVNRFDYKKQNEAWVALAANASRCEMKSDQKLGKEIIEYWAQTSMNRQGSGTGESYGRGNERTERIERGNKTKRIDWQRIQLLQSSMGKHSRGGSTEGSGKADSLRDLSNIDVVPNGKKD